MASNDTLERRSKLFESPPVGANCGGGDGDAGLFPLLFPLITFPLDPATGDADVVVVVVVELKIRDFVASILKLLKTYWALRPAIFKTSQGRNHGSRTKRASKYFYDGDCRPGIIF